MKFFTSDTHAFHKRIVEFTNRGIETNIEGHTDWLVNKINSSVKAGDLLYILGDVAFSNDFHKVAEFLERINGQKIVVKGNHDDTSLLEDLADYGVIQKWDHIVTTKVKDNHVVMCHYPIMSWDRQRYGSWHLHGHSHGNLSESKGLMLDVGIDNSYNLFGTHKVFSEDDIENFMLSQKIHVADAHRSYE